MDKCFTQINNLFTSTRKIKTSIVLYFICVTQKSSDFFYFNTINLRWPINTNSMDDSKNVNGYKLQ